MEEENKSLAPRLFHQLQVYVLHNYKLFLVVVLVSFVFINLNLYWGDLPAFLKILILIIVVFALVKLFPGVKEITGKIALILGISMCLFLMIESMEDDLRLEPFQVPEDFVKNGFDGAVTSNLMINKINKILSNEEMKSAQTMNEDDDGIILANSPIAKTNFQISFGGLGFQIGDLMKYFKSILKFRDNSVRGEIAQSDKGLKLVITFPGEPAEVLEQPIDSSSKFVALDKLLNRAGELFILKKGTDYQKAAIYYRMRDFKNAIYQLEKLAKKDPEDYRALNLWANVYVGMKDYEKANEKFKQAIAAYEARNKGTDKRFIEAYIGWGNCWMARGNLAKAREKFEEASKIDSTNEIVANNLIAVRLLQLQRDTLFRKKAEKTVEQIENITQQKDNNLLVLANKAQTYDKLYQKALIAKDEKQVEEFKQKKDEVNEQIIQQESQNSGEWSIKAQAYQELGVDSTANEYAQRALKNNPYDEKAKKIILRNKSDRSGTILKKPVKNK